jgi:ABC-type lipoprotein release transport system permease subunit
MLPLQTAQELFATYDRLSAVSIILYDAEKTEETAQNLREKLSTEDYDVMSWQDMMPELMQSIEADRGSGFILIIILYIVVGFGILGTVLMMISERTYEFGVMISVGTPRSTIFLILAVEIFVLALLGAGAGLLLSIPIAWYFNIYPIQITGDNMVEVMEIYGMEPVIQFATDPSIFYSQAIIVFIITLIFCVAPLLKASRLNPVKAMRS